MAIARVLVVDDHAIFRQGLAKLLEYNVDINVVGEASSGSEAEVKARELRPDVILMDVQMPIQNGIETARHIINEMPESRILFLTVSENDSDLLEALTVGARGYLVKTLGLDEVERSIVAVAQGQTVISPSSFMVKLLTEIAVSRNDSGYASKPMLVSLSEREKEILRFIVSGATNREVAIQLCIAETTVKTHLRNILDKLHLHNRVELAVLAFKEGWVPEHNAIS